MIPVGMMSDLSFVPCSFELRYHSAKDHETILSSQILVYQTMCVKLHHEDNPWSTFITVPEKNAPIQYFFFSFVFNHILETYLLGLSFQKEHRPSTPVLQSGPGYVGFSLSLMLL